MNDSMQSPQERGLSEVPTVLRRRTGVLLDALLPHVPPNTATSILERLPRVLATSEFVGRTLQARPALLVELLESSDVTRAYASTEMAPRLALMLTDVADDVDLKRRLRLFRQREMVRLAFRDLAGFADLPEVIATSSALADACIAAALERLLTWAKEKYGTPISDVSGAEAVFVVLALGKLGGHELNFSSDVDLMFAYSDDGETNGARCLSNHEFFIRLGQDLINTLAESSADGFVFRVDMRLRPNGASGPLALSFDAMEHYYQAHGRDWERYALIKARAIAGNLDAGDELLTQLKPFVFRKYLDYGAFEAIRSMRTMIEREMERKGMHEHVKLGPGGIREIEFIGQALQLIRAGREPPLQCRPILQALTRLAERGYLPTAACDELSAAYVFLRNVEHRLQMVADQQTHLLPRDADERTRLAFSMNFSDWPAFVAALTVHRRHVGDHFTGTFAIPGSAAGDEPEALATVWSGAAVGEAAAKILRTAGFTDAGAAASVIAGLRDGAAHRALSTEGRQRLDRLMPKLLAAAGSAADPATTLARGVHLLEAIGRRTTYLAMLAENPMALAQLVKLCGASEWIARWIAQHPIVLDELLDPRSLYEPLTHAALAAELRGRMSSIPEADLELQMEVLREFHHSHVLRVAAADIGPGLPPEQVGAHLACIAEVLLDECLSIAWRVLTARHGRPSGAAPGFAVIGYGKLGGRELGYASDLDMIFLYDGSADGATDGPRSIANEQFYIRLGQRLIQLLTTRTPSGVLYEVDMRLRPSGQSGTLVTRLATFGDYQKQRAWTWEHQALVRARPVAGLVSLKDAFAAVRHEILCQSRDPAKLKQDVVEMRGRMAVTHTPPAAGFDLKYSRGGIVDIEFMVQYWALRWAHSHPMLTRHTDDINILDALRAEGLLEAERSELLKEAYRRYLSLEHRLKLADRGSVTDPATLGDLPERVGRVWDETFND